jgi:hypothetical protein
VARFKPTDKPTSPEEAEEYPRMYPLREAAELTGRHRVQLQQWISAGRIFAIRAENTGRRSWLIPGAQLAEIWRKGTRANYVRPIELAEARKRSAQKHGI